MIPTYRWAVSISVAITVSNVVAECFSPSYSGGPSLDYEPLYRIIRVYMKRCLCVRHEGIYSPADTAARTLKRNSRRKWVVSFTLRPLNHRGSWYWCPSNRRLGVPQSRSALFTGERYLPSHESNHSIWIVYTTAQSLYWLRNRDSC